jgi:hypothetical protein
MIMVELMVPCRGALSPPLIPEPWIPVALIVPPVIQMDTGCSQPSSAAYPVPLPARQLAVI